MKNNKGVSLMTLIVTIVVMLIITGVAINKSIRLIDDSVKATEDAEIFDDNEQIRSLLMNAITDKSLVTGYALINNSVEVIDAEGNVYGTNYHLIPGGDEEDLKAIAEKFGETNVIAYKGITAPYVVDYYTSKFVRIEDVLFK